MAPAPAAEAPVVLVATTDPADRVQLPAHLGNPRYQLVFAGSMAEVRTLLKESSVAVLVAEANVGTASWRDFISAIRETGGHSRLIVFDARADEALWLDVLDSGGFDVILKPGGARQLRDSVQTAFADWLYLR